MSFPVARRRRGGASSGVVRGRRASLPILFAAFASAGLAGDLVELRYGDPDLVVDLGVGLWALPLPMDYDRDGDLDMVVATVNKPSPGVFFFENPDGSEFPVFERAVRVSDAVGNMTVSYAGGDARVAAPGKEFPRFRETGIAEPRPVPFKPDFHTGRANQWKFVDFDGDGPLDLIVGASDWREYGWDDAYDSSGNWTNGPLHAHVWFMRNEGDDGAPRYAAPAMLDAGGAPLDVYGAPSPNFADFDGDGDLDLVCGEFLDKLTWFENVGDRRRPRYAEGRRLAREDGEPIALELQMLQVVALDWDADGDVDLIVGEEDGRVAYLEREPGFVAGAPRFAEPRHFRQRADLLKCGVLATPVSADWDGDGDEDFVCGDTAGFVNFIENLDGGDPPRWAPPKRLSAGGEIVRIQAGPNGSIQGPAEAKWGYTAPGVADWDGDGDLDILINSIWGKIVWFENVASPTAPELAPAKPVEVAWPDPEAAPYPEWNWWKPAGSELVTQWRTTPFPIDLDGDGLVDLAMLDHEGYLAFFRRERTAEGALRLLPGARIFVDESGAPLRPNDGRAGKSGRRKFVATDWDGDGRIDLLLNSKNAEFLRNETPPGEPAVASGGKLRFRKMGGVSTRLLAGHTTCPTVADWDRDGVPDLVVGAEDGFFYAMKNPRSAPAAE